MRRSSTLFMLVAGLAAAGLSGLPAGAAAAEGVTGSGSDSISATPEAGAPGTSLILGNPATGQVITRSTAPLRGTIVRGSGVAARLMHAAPRVARFPARNAAGATYQPPLAIPHRPHGHPPSVVVVVPPPRPVVVTRLEGGEIRTTVLPRSPRHGSGSAPDGAPPARGGGFVAR